MWCLFILIHHSISFRSWSQVGTDWLNPSNYFFLGCAVLTAIFGLATLLKPSSKLLFLLMLVFWSLLKFDNMPAIPNHIIVALCINLFWIVSISMSLIRNELNDGGGIYRRIEPYLKYSVFILYFFSVFHKLNADFFNPEVSCAVELYSDISSSFPFLPNSNIHGLLIYGTLIAEAAIPVLLLIRRTQLAGILLAIWFHFFLSLHSNVYIMSFSAEIYALLIPFLPSFAVQKIEAQIRSFRANYKYIIPGLFLLVILIVLLFGLSDLSKTIFSFGWAIWSGILFITSIWLFFTYRFRSGDKLRFVFNPWFAFITALLFFNGITPYLGIKTATNFSMFSNLLVSGETTNHLLLPKSLPIVDYSSDLVDIIDTNDPYLGNVRMAHARITFFELERWLQEHGDEQSMVLIYNHNGKLINLKGATTLASKGISDWLQKKFLIFRVIPADGPCPCQW